MGATMAFATESSVATLGPLGEGATEAEVWGWVYPGLSNQGTMELVRIASAKDGRLANDSADVRMEGFEEARVESQWDESGHRVILNPNKDSYQASILAVYQLATQAKIYFSQHLGFEEVAKTKPLFIEVTKKFDRSVGVDGCGAEASYGEITFTGENKKCLSMVEPKSLFHEYTHQVDLWLGGESDNDLAEGLADMAAVFITQSPEITVLPLKSAKKVVRSCKNSIKYSYRQKNSPEADVYYRQGQAWCGFAWDAREELIKKYGESEGVKKAEDLFFSPLRYDSKTIPDAVERVFYQHSPDGIFSHGHDFKILKSAAQKHGFKVGESAESI
jgi:hypothetical protein